MPRAATPPYLYSLPAVYLAVPGTTILVDQHNSPLQDIAATLNTATPIQYGGTGATTLAGAQTNLGIIASSVTSGYPLATGTGDALIVTNATPLSALADGVSASLTTSADNTTAATINVDGLGVRALRKIVGGTDVALIAKDLLQAARYGIVYSSTANAAAGAWIVTIAKALSSVFSTSLVPGTSGAPSLGSSSLQWLNAYLATGGTINFANGDVVVTHSTGVVTVSTGDLRVTTAGTNAASAVTVGGTQTLTSKTLTSPIINTSLSGSAFGTGVATFLATPSSANLRAALTDESGTGNALFQSGDLGTPSAGVATNLTGTAASLTAGTATVANGLKSATTTVGVSGATAPTSGQLLTATSGTNATWQDPAASGQPIPTSSTYAVGTFCAAFLSGSVTVADGGTTSGTNLLRPSRTTGGGGAAYSGAALSGTWMNVSGGSCVATSASGAGASYGYWVRTA